MGSCILPAFHLFNGSRIIKPHRIHSLASEKWEHYLWNLCLSHTYYHTMNVSHIITQIGKPDLLPPNNMSCILNTPDLMYLIPSVSEQVPQLPSVLCLQGLLPLPLAGGPAQAGPLLPSTVTWWVRIKARGGGNLYSFTLQIWVISDAPELLSVTSASIRPTVFA